MSIASPSGAPAGSTQYRHSGTIDLRALETGTAFWLAMFTASAFGTNVGDWWVDELGMTGVAGSLILAAACITAIGLDRRTRRFGELWYWISVVALRAIATNIADASRHALGIGFPVLALMLGAAALAAGWVTRHAASRAGSPIINGPYWIAMLLAGVFGTVGGDWAAAHFGLRAAAVILMLLLVVVLWLRMHFVPATMTAYWVAVLTERCAATPAGDWLASGRGAGLGLPVAMACTGSLFAAALLWRHWRTRL